MGHHLRTEYGDDLVIVGFDFYQGEFRALTLSDAGTGEILDTTAISGTSRIELSWNDRPQDLLPAPLERYASSLFEDR